MENDMIKVAAQELPNARKGKGYTLLGYEKRCKQCSNIFLGNKRRLYCSSICKTNAKDARLKLYIEKGWVENPEIIYEINPYWQNKKSQISKRCVFCGESFIYEKNMATRKFCNKECHNEFLKSNHKLSLIFSKKCEVCSNCFDTNKPHQKVCSKKCREDKREMRKNMKWFEIHEEETNPSFLKLRFEIFKRDNFTCQYCGRNVKDDKIKLHADHINPVANGGLNKINNLITSCSDCNIGKKDVKLDDILLGRNIKNLKGGKRK